MDIKTQNLIALTSKLNQQAGSNVIKPHVLKALVRALAQDPENQKELNRLADEQRRYNQMLQAEQARGPAVQIVDSFGVESWNPQFASRLERGAPKLFRQLVAQRKERQS